MCLLLTLLLFISQTAYAADDVESALRAMPRGRESLIQLFEGEGEPVLLVHGIDLSGEMAGWRAPLETLLATGRPVYFFRWSKRSRLEASAWRLGAALESLWDGHPQEKLTMVAFSAGGVVSGLALARLAGQPGLARTRFHSVASPFFGYGAPARLAYVIAPFAGVGTVQVGRGASRRDLSRLGLAACEHWVTTDCRLDPKHSCPIKGVLPLRGRMDGSSPMPCGEEATHAIAGEDHQSVKAPVFRALFP